MPGHQQIILDTEAFLPFLYEKPHFEDQLPRSNTILESLRGLGPRDNFETVIPQICIGEAFAKFYGNVGPEERPEQPFQEKLLWYCDQVDPVFRDPGDHGSEYADRLYNKDTRLDNTDLVIAATALSCEHSTQLITDDTTLHQTEAIEELSTELESDGERYQHLSVEKYYQSQ
jgi:predicted nucleic acid-binding protein